MAISRRTVGLGAASLLAVPHVARAKSRTLRLGHGNPPDSVLQTAAQAFAEIVSTGSGGRLSVDISPNAVLGTEVQMLNATVNGSLDIAILPIGSVATVKKEVDLIETPYLFADAAQARALLDGRLGETCAEMLSPTGLEVLSWAEVGLRHITANRPIRRPGDLKGLRIRMPISDVMVESFRLMGANPGALAFPQVPDALRSGQFDAQENQVNVIVSAQLYKQQSHLSLTGHVYTPAPFVISTAVLEDFSPADRVLMRKAALAGAKASRLHSSRMETTGLTELQQAGMTVVSDIDRAAFLATGPRAMEELSKTFGPDVIARFRGAMA